MICCYPELLLKLSNRVYKKENYYQSCCGILFIQVSLWLFNILQLQSYDQIKKKD